MSRTSRYAVYFSTALQVADCVLLIPQIGQHIPGWVDLAKFERLSFADKWPKFSQLFYGDWVYDEYHGGITVYEDEYGEVVEEPGCGPQASFQEDMAAALKRFPAVARYHF
jgi:hypothetical protein